MPLPKPSKTTIELTALTDKFLINPTLDKVGHALLTRLGFRFRPAEGVKDCMWAYMPDLLRMGKQEQDEYRRKHPAVLTVPHTYKDENLNGKAAKS